MLSKKEFERAYEAARDDDIDFLNDFCSEWDGKAEIEDIPYFMRLYVGGAMTPAQNQFPTGVIGSVLKKNGKAATCAILQNLGILTEECSESCILYLMAMLWHYHNDNDSLEDFASAIINADSDIENQVMQYVLKRFEETEDERVKSMWGKLLAIYRD